MNAEALRALLKEVANGERDVEAALADLRTLPFEDIGFATVDHHRALRWGFPEVIYCAGKTPEQVAGIAERIAAHSPRLLGTRASLAHYDAARERIPELQYHEMARCLWLDREPERSRHDGRGRDCRGHERPARVGRGCADAGPDGPPCPSVFMMWAWPGCTGWRHMLRHCSRRTWSWSWPEWKARWQAWSAD